MGYSNLQMVERVLANALTRGSSATTDVPKSLFSINSTFDRNVIDPDLVYQFITWADEEIDAKLTALYVTPLTEVVDLELSLLSDINEYNDVIELDSTANLVPGDVLIFIDGSQEERHIVDTVVNNFTIELADNLLGFYSSSTARVLRIKYPAPISLVSSRMVAGNIFDKFFASQASENMSDYGNKLRAMAVRDLNNVLQGRTVLHGQRRIGNRFFNSNLDDRYGLPEIDGDASRDMEQIS